MPVCSAMTVGELATLTLDVPLTVTGIVANALAAELTMTTFRGACASAGSLNG